jgi:hypothetical protein
MKLTSFSLIGIDNSIVQSEGTPPLTKNDFHTEE